MVLGGRAEADREQGERPNMRKLTKAELKRAVRAAVDAVALAHIRTGKCPSKDEREFIVQQTADAMARGEKDSIWLRD